MCWVNSHKWRNTHSDFVSEPQESLFLNMTFHIEGFAYASLALLSPLPLALPLHV